MRSFRNQSTGPPAQASAIVYYTALRAEVQHGKPHPLQAHCLAAEWMIIYAVSQLYNDRLENPNVAMVRNFLWELRRCSLIHPSNAAMPIDFPEPEPSFVRMFNSTNNLVPARDSAEIPPVQDGAPKRGRPKKKAVGKLDHFLYRASGHDFLPETGRVEKVNKGKGRQS